MFLTITIDTKGVHKKKLRMAQSRISPRNGWQKRAVRRRPEKTFWQKFVTWKRGLGEKAYRLGGQIAMF